MINVTKHGKYFKRYAIVCPRCYCEFTCDKSDMLITGIGRTINCPECKTVIRAKI